MRVVRGAKRALKGPVNALLRPLGYEVTSLPAPNIVPVDLYQWTSYFKGDEIRERYDESLKASGVAWSDNFAKQCRFYGLYQAAKHVIDARIPGDFAECGCWKGHSTHLISGLLKRGGFHGEFHVFDSFEGGLSDLDEEDANERFEFSAEEVQERKTAFASSEGEVRETLREFDFVRLYKGWIPERFDEVSDRRFAFVNIDVDLHDPTRASLAFFYPRLNPGGVVYLDDYGVTTFPGAQTAIDEFLSRDKPSFFFAMPTGGALVVK